MLQNTSSRFLILSVSQNLEAWSHHSLDFPFTLVHPFSTVTFTDVENARTICHHRLAGVGLFVAKLLRYPCARIDEIGTAASLFHYSSRVPKAMEHTGIERNANK